MYTTNIKKWGNSLAVRIPKHVAEELHIDQHTEVDLQVAEGELHIKPKAVPHYSLDDLLPQISADNTHREIETGTPQGNEVW